MWVGGHGIGTTTRPAPRLRASLRLRKRRSDHHEAEEQAVIRVVYRVYHNSLVSLKLRDILKCVADVGTRITYCSGVRVDALTRGAT
jgi:hypothetical protein